MDKTLQLTAYLKRHPQLIGKVVDLDASVDSLYQFDLTATNIALSADTFSDTGKFTTWVDQKLRDNNCRYGIGGYMENRTIYSRSAHFNTDDEPRRLHLGVDIWAAAGTLVYCPLAGKVHSFMDNNNFGDYGPTIILAHKLDNLTLYSLYGHLSRKSLAGLKVGAVIAKNQLIADFGNTDENGNCRRTCIFN